MMEMPAGKRSDLLAASTTAAEALGNEPASAAAPDKEVVDAAGIATDEAAETRLAAPALALLLLRLDAATAAATLEMPGTACNTFSSCCSLLHVSSRPFTSARLRSRKRRDASLHGIGWW